MRLTAKGRKALRAAFPLWQQAQQRVLQQVGAESWAETHRRLLDLCQRPGAVADLASGIDLPLGVVRVLLGDLSQRGLISVVRAAGRSTPQESVLRSVLDGLRAL